VRLRAFFANLLTDIPFLERVDELIPKQQGDQHRRNRRVGGTERHVLKDIQRLYEIPILIFESREDQLVK